MSRPHFHRLECLDTEGRRISDRFRRRGMQISILAGALGMGWWGMTQGMPLTMFMEALGASGVLIGLASTVIQFSLVMQMAAALISPRFRSRKKAWGLVMLISRGLWFVPVVLLAVMSNRPVLIARLMIMLVAVSSVLGQSVSAFWYSWMTDLVPAETRGRFWGLRQSWTMLAFLAGMAFAGLVLDAFPTARTGAGSWAGFALVFTFGAALGCGDILVHMFVPEPVSVQHKARYRWPIRMLAPLRRRDFRRLTTAMGIYTFAVGLISLGIVYLRRDFGITYMQLAGLTISASVGTVLSGFAWGYIMDRIGGRAFGVIMLLVAPVLLSAWFFVRDYETSLPDLVQGVWGFGAATVAVCRALPPTWARAVHGYTLPQPVWIMILTNFFAGAFYGGIALCQLTLSGALAPRRDRTMAMAVHWCAVGLIGGLGTLVAGKVMDVFQRHPLGVVLPTGTPLGFHHVLVLLHVGIVWGAVVPLVLRIRRRAAEPPVRTALSQLLVANPLRLVTNVYLMGAAVTSRRRARAVRRLAGRGGAIAVSDLVKKLDDASFDVREETALALGSIGSVEAVDALAAKLEDPESDLAPQIARALRQTRSRRGVDALVRRLQDPDRETRSEVARALGEIGDRRAVPPLLALLSGSDDPKVISSSSAALARLGALAAIYEILPRMKATRNPVLKTSLAVAVGDLLGERDGFYKVLTREQQVPGSEVNRMLRDLRRRFRQFEGIWSDADIAELVETLREIEQMYEEGNFKACSTGLSRAAFRLAGMRGAGPRRGAAAPTVESLVWEDEQFGVGAWYLELLREGWEAADLGFRDSTDILLGLYFLACRGVPPRTTAAANEKQTT